MNSRDEERGGGYTLSAHRRSPVWILAVLFMVLIPLTACDSLDELLEVDLPGQVVDESLNSPELAETLVRSAQGDFECALRGHLFGIEAGWSNSFRYVSALIEMILIANRKDRVREVGQRECTSGRDPIWFTMHRARMQAAESARRIQDEMPEGSVEARDFLLAKAYAFEGYATQHLAEPWCEMVFDGSGEVVSREDAMRRAEDRFTSSIEHGQAALSGPRSDDAREILNLARVGRARVRLNLGDGMGVLEDAEQVDQDFAFYATYDPSPARRQNMVDDLEDDYVLHPTFRKLGILPNGRTLSDAGDAIHIQTERVDGSPTAMADPRVPTEYIGQHSSGPDWWVQRKFSDTGTDIPFATWREAQLMIAEVEGGPRAVSIINELRGTVGDVPWVTGNPDLPQFNSTDEDEINAHVLEERRRELFLQGHKIGDDLRTGHWKQWDSGTSPVGQQYGDNSCMPVPDIEFF